MTVHREVTTTKRTYESLYIIDVNSTIEQVQAVCEKFTKLVKDQDGEVIAAGKWDKRRLAYEIKGKREGLYMLMYFTGEAAVVSELDRVMRISDDVIRHIILAIEPEYMDVTRVTAPDAEEATPVPETAEPAPAAVEPEAQPAVEEAPVAAEPAAEEAPAEPAAEG